MTKRIVALTVATLAIAAIVPSLASAAKFTTNISIAISGNASRFGGAVSSSHGACVKARTVRLERKAPGGSFAVIGQTTSSGTGAWNVSTNVARNFTYRAVVLPKTIKGDTCQGRTSKTQLATKSTVSIQQGAGNFHGTVGSNQAPCLGTRAVRLWHKSLPYGQQFNRIGNTTSASNGTWHINTVAVSGDAYFASILARSTGTLACLPASSSVIIAH